MSTLAEILAEALGIMFAFFMVLVTLFLPVVLAVKFLAWVAFG